MHENTENLQDVEEGEDDKGVDDEQYSSLYLPGQGLGNPGSRYPSS